MSAQKWIEEAKMWAEYAHTLANNPAARFGAFKAAVFAAYQAVEIAEKQGADPLEVLGTYLKKS